MARPWLHIKRSATARNRRDNRATCGETLTEALVSVLVGGLALILLATVIATAAHITSGSRESMDDYFQNGNQLAAYAADGSGGVSTTTGQVSITDGTGETVALTAESSQVAVDYYVSGTDTAEPVASYETQDGAR